MFVVTGPYMLILDAVSASGLADEYVISWFMMGPLVGAVLTVVLNIWFRQPLFISMTMHGSLVVAASLARFSFPEVVGAYVMTGIIVCLLAVTGLAKRIVSYLPLPIVLGMVTGVLFPFSVRGINAVIDLPLLAGSAFIVFLLASRFRARLANIPPTFWAAAVAIALAGLTDQADWSRFHFKLGTPVFVMPTFTLRAFVELTLPLVVMLIGVHGTQAAGILQGAGYTYKAKTFTLATGIGSTLVGLFGSTPYAIMGPPTAMLLAGLEPEEKPHRWRAGVAAGFLIGGIGLVSPVIAGVRNWLPGPLVSAIAALAVIGILGTYLSRAFSGRFRTGAMFAFIITASGISFFDIGSPLWGVLGGLIVSVVTEPDDFRIFWDGDK